MEAEFREIHAKCAGATMTSVLRMYSLYNATRFVVARGLAGAVVECGVWKGGSSMLAAMTLAKCGDTARDLYMYDTYEGMSAPTEKDRKFTPLDVNAKWAESNRDGHNEWCYSSLDEVKSNMDSTGYPTERIHFVKGMVEKTIPETIPQQIAILRLDTDFYESTYHELVHLYPRLVPGGVLILDDYGTWQGAKEAVDQYFAENRLTLLLNKIDQPGRIALKC